MDQVRSKSGGRNNLMQRSHLQGAFHAMHTVELVGHLAQFFGMYDFEEFVPLGTQASFLCAAGVSNGLVQGLQPWIFASPGIDFAGKNDGGSGRTSNHRSISALQSHDLEIFVQRTRENYVRPAVIARDHAKDHRALEVDDSASDLRAILKL